MFDTEGPYQVFLRYRLRKYRENTNQYHTEIPNRDTTLHESYLWIFGNLSVDFQKTGHFVSISGDLRNKINVIWEKTPQIEN
jgi:hypothetical protein